MNFILVVFLSFIFLSLVGNSWVIFIIARRRRLRTTANWFILSLAAADLGVTCAFSSYMICEVILDTCKEVIGMIFAFFFANVSAMGLIAVVAERYIAWIFAEIRPCLHYHQKNIIYYWNLLGITISVPRFATRHESCRRGKTFVFKIPFLRWYLHFSFCSVTNSASLDSTFSYPTNCSQTLSANESSHETS